jgi:hypothetical protein
MTMAFTFEPTDQLIMEKKRPITLAVDLRSAEIALQLAQFCKRSTFDTFFDMTEAHLSYDARMMQAYQAMNGIDAVSRALAAAGISPR